MKQPLYQVDAFTGEAFRGNPAAVCILSGPQGERWMQSVAMEMNLSETAFLLKRGDDFDLRWFTPKAEVDLCGHATLASAHVLWESGIVEGERMVRFQTRSGLLTAERHGSWIELNFPEKAETAAERPDALIQALGVEPVHVGKNQFDYIVEVDSERTVRELKPDFALLQTVPARGIIVTSIAEAAEYDFVSRFFAPGLGVPEDPVTGSAHCCLGPYWRNKLNKERLTAYQASERGGILKLRFADGRVFIAGQAVTVMTGELLF